MFRKPNTPGKKGNLSQFGLLDIPDTVDDVNDDMMDLSDDDIDLEAELAAISGGGGHRQRPKKPAPVPAANLDAMIAESLKDVPSDNSGDDVSDGEDDPELLSELKELALDDEEAIPPPRTTRPAPPPPTATQSVTSSIVTLLEERISNYSIAEKNAKQNGESSRARRFARGLKTLNDLLKQAKAGRSISDEDIPPAVSLGNTSDTPKSPAQPVSPLINFEETPPKPQETPSEPVELPSARELSSEEPPGPPEPSHPPPPLPPVDQSETLDPEKQKGLQVILKRKEELKAAALACKHAGDKALALEYLKVVKQFDMVVDAYRSGQEMDLNELPTPDTIAAAFKTQQKEEDTTQNSAEVPPAPEPAAAGLITASTVDEALKQRLSAFQEQEAKAKADGNASKARRLGRVVKQYQDAIRLHAAGKPIPSDELPTPAGYGPLPTDQSAAAPRTPSKPSQPPAPARPSPPPPRQAPSRYDKQLAFLLQRQKIFKEAAIKAKKEGNIEQAKEYLRAAKGFDSVIEAARGGLTVDLKSLPLPPTAKDQLEHTFDVVSAEDCGPAEDGASSIPASLGDEDVLARLHQQLAGQLKLCLANRDHYKAMGNVADANRFEHLAVTVKQDLDVVSVAKALGQIPPKFHYESRQFSMVQCNTDLNENDLELTIERGISYNVPNPKEVDTYVRFEFPYPQEAPVSDRTATVKDTNSPQYSAVFPLAIHRGARPCLRVFKRHGIKFEVYAKGGACGADGLCCCSGWFSSDKLLGTVLVKLEPLETHVTLHDSFPLMNGRRAAGGSLEVKLRLRTPLLQPQVEHTTHRWLVIDSAP